MPAPRTSKRSSRRRRREAVDLVVVGPEAPLVDGVVDALEEAGIPAFGPTAAAAQLEGSKVHAKEMMAEAGVPTAGHAVLRNAEEALEPPREIEYPAVLKADGLAAGKGVIICEAEDGRARRHRRLLQPAALRPDRGRPRGLPRRRGALAPRALRRRERRAARPRAGLQAHLRLRRGTQHRRDGELLPGARVRRRARRGARRRSSTARSSSGWPSAARPSTASSTRDS